MILDLTKQRHKIFCWVQDPGLPNITPHGLALGDDGVMLGICPENLPSTIMPALTHQSSLFDDHFGQGNWELEFVSQLAVENIGTNKDFDTAIALNQKLGENLPPN